MVLVQRTPLGGRLPGPTSEEWTFTAPETTWRRIQRRGRKGALGGWGFWKVERLVVSDAGDLAGGFGLSSCVSGSLHSKTFLSSNCSKIQLFSRLSGGRHGVFLAFPCEDTFLPSPWGFAPPRRAPSARWSSVWRNCNGFEASSLNSCRWTCRATPTRRWPSVLPVGRGSRSSFLGVLRRKDVVVVAPRRRPSGASSANRMEHDGTGALIHRGNRRNGAQWTYGNRLPQDMRHGSVGIHSIGKRMVVDSAFRSSTDGNPARHGAPVTSRVTWWNGTLSRMWEASNRRNTFWNGWFLMKKLVEWLAQPPWGQSTEALGVSELTCHRW